MKQLTEGRKMFVSVMAIFAVYAVIFIVFEDYDRRSMAPMSETSDWHLLGFTLVVMSLLAILLHRYAQRMDERISREKEEQHAQMRRELTQNISHELKTPVASILGYMETLIDNPDMAPATQQQFIRRSHQQAKRLTALLHDISTLNRMDYAAENISWQPVNVSQLVADIVSETTPLLEKQHMTFDNQLPADIMVEGNDGLIYSIFRNILDNSVCYAGEGTHIVLSAIEFSDSWWFNFSDNGVGIPAEHLSRLFERFYRIDKGRSRQMGGTGLGLAIVKNAVLLHGGTITTHNGNNGGVSFTFTLKKLKAELHSPPPEFQN